MELNGKAKSAASKNYAKNKKSKKCSPMMSNGDISALICDLLELEREVEDFQELDELGKIYAIDWPFTSCSQLGLGGLFRLYSGRRSDSAGSGADPADSVDEMQQDSPGILDGVEMTQEQAATEKALRINRLLSVASAGVAGQQAVAAAAASPFRKRRKRSHKSRLVASGLSWCKFLKLLSNHGSPGATAMCCISNSETMTQLPASHSNQSELGGGLIAQQQLEGLSTSPSIQELIGLDDDRLISTMFEHDQDENDADQFLSSETSAKRDALELLGPLASQLRSGSWADAMRAQSFAQRTGRSLLLDPTNEAPLERGCRVSICLLDRRRHGRNKLQIELQAENGRRYALARTRLAQIELRLRCVRDAKESNQTIGSKHKQSLEQVARKLVANLNEAMRKLDQSMKQQSAIKNNQHHKHHQAATIKSCNGPVSIKVNENDNEQQQQDQFTNGKKGDQIESLIELTKGSLNNLIDAQLLLRNKLKMELQQNSSLPAQTLQSPHPATSSQLHSSSQHSILAATCSTTNLSPHLIEHHYETLLRNNFNLLKIWQNLVETKKLASFVCEPIKASLGDLFWFSRERARLNHLVCKPSVAEQLLTSPTLSLDGVQVKRGLIQILEALNYLHLYCRLIHRNVNPNNILIGAGDNWKLAGLEFALRFESTTVSESNSIMRLESCATQTLSSSNLKANFRRQRTLHQTKCPEFQAPAQGKQSAGATASFLQPQLDYLAPEIFRKAQCSHKSDLFSFGLVVVQTYDFGRHKKPLGCNSNPDLYLQQIDRLSQSAEARVNLTRLVPFEMRPLVCEMLECEPNLRPAANFAIQLLKRPIEFVDDTMDCVRHLKGALSELDGPGLWGAQQGTKFNHQQPQTSAAPMGGEQASTQAANHGQTGKTCTITTTTSAAMSSQNNIKAGGPNSPNWAQSLGGWNKGAKFFRKVTTLKRREPQRLEPRNVRLLSLYRRALDSMLSVPPNPTQSDTPTADWNSSSNSNNNVGISRQQPISFDNLRTEFELGLESLRQFGNLWSSSTAPSATAATPAASLAAGGAPSASCQFALHDSRSLLLSIALHRRLLDQVSTMRAELPPLSRLVQVHPSRLNENHKSLAELEDRFIALLCRQSLPKLWQSLADPMLKLDEFIIVFELVSDLLAFVGFKSRQAFSLRGKQLLNDLTPPSACLSSSSSEEDDADLHAESSGLINFNDTSALETQQQYLNSNISNQLDYQQQQQQASTHTNMSGMIPRYQLQMQGNNDTNIPTIIQNDLDTHALLPRGKSPTNSMHRYSMQANVVSSQQLISTSNQQQSIANKLPNTKISITAPSPMGSVRDLSQPMRSPRRSLQPSEESDLVELTQELMLKEDNRRSNDVNVVMSAGDAATTAAAEPDEKSRNDLMDKLLSRINDDSFNKVVDINHQKIAQQQQQARPKSAIDSTCGNIATANRHSSSINSNPGTRLATSNVNNSSSSNNNNNSSSSSTTPFDMNVIRRMSTNLVQNFNRMSGTNLGGAGQGNDQSPQQYNFQASDPDNHQNKRATSSTNANNNNNNIISNNTNISSSNNYATNSLYVETQVPARRHSDNTINIPKIQVGGLTSPGSHGSRSSLLASVSGPKQSVSVTKLANKWKLSTTGKGYTSNQKESSDKLSPALSSALGYMRRHSSGNTTGGNNSGNSNNSGGGGSGGSTSNHHHHHNNNHHSNGHSNTHLLFGGSTYKTKSSSNLGLDFLISNRSMKRRCSAASMLGHQTQRKAEDLLDAGMKSMRLTYRRRLSYNTKSNRRAISKTPGGKLVYLYPKKPGSTASCGDCKNELRGIVFARPQKLAKIARHRKTVSRAYGGTKCVSCVRQRILRAFLIEEGRLVAKVIKQQQVGLGKAK